MQMIKYTHACVRLEDGERRLVIDPGLWSEVEALAGVADVLITHEHYDHVDSDKLAEARQDNPNLRVYAPASVAGQLAALGDSVVTVSVGDRFTAGGFSVRAVGGEHAEIYEGLPGCANVGYLVDESLYHPGDSLFRPDAAVETLLVPAAAPWLKLAEALDFVRDVKPARAYPIHDALLSEVGQHAFDNWMDLKGSTDYTRPQTGEPVSL
ncbi:MBL fold metallo-hydrolase [Rugosimonospora acidiphila]|uniref:MBL fold metallo-hydrolase n=1 Tax=Rugosimonospora acidiphila TaxID=556531 RepID=A0ABP9RXV6_9ACTN